jgi:hypothetical protein
LFAPFLSKLLPSLRPVVSDAQRFSDSFLKDGEMPVEE